MEEACSESVGAMPTAGTIMNAGHIAGRMRNRLKRLSKKVKEASADRQGQMASRMRELEEALRIDAIWRKDVKV